MIKTKELTPYERAAITTALSLYYERRGADNEILRELRDLCADAAKITIHTEREG